MSAAATWALALALLVVLGLASLFLFGWRKRREKMPDVPPLPPEEDDWKK